MCFIKKWSDDPKPDIIAHAKKYYKRPGNIVIDGDSNAFPMSPDFFGPDCTLFAMPGTIPQNCILNHAEILQSHYPIKKLYIQTGGNESTWKPYSITPLDYNAGEFTHDMGKLIELYLQTMNADDIVIASLPYVNPELKMRDLTSYKTLPKQIRNRVGGTKINYIFIMYNSMLRPLCESMGVHYLDIFHIGKTFWDNGGRKFWWDSVHYDSRVRGAIQESVKGLWKI